MFTSTLIPRYLFEIVMEDAWERYRPYMDIRFKHEDTVCGPQMIGAQAARWVELNVV